MEKRWSYRDFEIREGLKPGSKHFQYFFVVSEGKEKKCKYCVWIEDDALSRFDPSKAFESIVALNREDWTKWVKGKLDGRDFTTVVLKYGEEGEEEIKLAEMEEKLTLD